MNFTKEQLLFAGKTLLFVAIFLTTLQVLILNPFSQTNDFVQILNSAIIGLSLGCFTKARNRSELWGLLGFVIGYFGFISLVFLKDNNEETK